MTNTADNSEYFPTLTDVVGEPTGGFPALSGLGEATGAYSLHTQVIDTTLELPLQENEAELKSDETNFLIHFHQNFEAHLASVFTEKLQQHLAEAQQQAIERALIELKNELPQLIAEAIATAQDPT